ncbi:MAG: hypothetical protein ACKOCF_07880 [Gammaproteobacteria bacterium]
MSEQPKNKIYWTEGVTRKEVETALSANKHPRLYRRWARRSLVVMYTVLIVLLVFASVIANYKAASYIAAIAGATLIGLFFALRFSVRLIGDAPTELLDERLIAIRDRTYLSAYRWLPFVIGTIFGVGIVQDFSFGIDRWGPVLVAFVMLIGGLPSMILAWKLPSEEP